MYSFWQFEFISFYWKYMFLIRYILLQFSLSQLRPDSAYSPTHPNQRMFFHSLPLEYKEAPITITIVE